jgi:hypothetical protein
MSTITTTSSFFNSTDTCPSESREWWRAEAKRVGTNWHSLLEAAAAALSRYCVVSACPTCGNTPCRNPHFCALCRDADARKAREQKPPDRRQGGAAASTVEALMLGLRERGTKALTEPEVRRRLSELSDQQVIDVGNRLQRLKPEFANAWTAQEVQALFKARVGQ